jgi:WD40 repeat protein
MQPIQVTASIDHRRLALGFGLAGLLAAILFSTSAAKAAEDDRAIFVMQRDGTNVRQVVSLKDFKWLGNPRWSHDGKRLAFDARQSGKSRLFTIGTDGKNLLDLGEGAMPSWSPDDKQLAFQEFAGTGPKVAADVWVENVDGKGRVRLIEGLAPRWSPDGSRIVLAGTSLRIFDMIETKPRDVFESGQKIDATVGFDWSPDGKRLAAIIERNGGRELVFVSADAPDKKITTRLRGNLQSVAWSPRENLLAVSIRDDKSERQQVCLLSADGEKPAELIAGQEGDNHEASWSPDGTQLAFASSRTTGVQPAVAVQGRQAWLELVRTHDPGGETYNMAFLPDGRSALLGGGLITRRIELWDTTTDQARQFSIGAWSVATSPDGRRAACALSQGKTVQYIDLDDGSVIREMVQGRQVVSLDFSHDGAKLATTGEDKDACIFNVESGEEQFRMHHPDKLAALKWSPDGRLLAVNCADKKLRLWDTATGKLAREIEHVAVPYALAISPDGQRVATGVGGEPVGPLLHLNFKPLDENPIYEWDITTGRQLRELKGHTYAVFGLDYSPDGKYLVSASFDGSVRLWDAEQGVELDRVTGEGFAARAIFSPDGSHILVAGGFKRKFDGQATFFDPSLWTAVPLERVRLFKVASGTRPGGDN